MSLQILILKPQTRSRRIEAHYAFKEQNELPRSRLSIKRCLRVRERVHFHAASETAAALNPSAPGLLSQLLDQERDT